MRVPLVVVAIPFGLAVLGIAGLIGFASSLRFTTYESGVPCTVIKTEVVKTSESSSYRLFCKEETFDVVDDVITGNFRSSDLYGQLSSMEGEQVHLDVYGLRIGWLSAKRNTFRISE